MESSIGVRLAERQRQTSHFTGFPFIFKKSHLAFSCWKGTTFFETAKFYGIFSVTITKNSIFHAVLGISSLGYSSVEKTECDGGHNEGKVLFLRIV